MQQHHVVRICNNGNGIRRDCIAILMAILKKEFYTTQCLLKVGMDLLTGWMLHDADIII
jgi:hypothetical protein